MILALVRARSTAAEAESQLAASALAKTPAAAYRELARSLVDRHPADAVLYRLAGWTEATRPGGQPRLALAWLNRALYLRSLDPDTHRVVARALFQLGASQQALVEERLALESGAETATVLAESLPRAPDLEMLWALVGDTPAHVDGLVTALWARGRRDDARALLERAVETFQGRPEAAALTVTAARVRLETGDAAGALELLQQAERAGEEVALTRAAALVALGRRREAIQVLESAVARHPSDPELAFALAGNWLGENKPALARAALERLKPFLTGSGQHTRLLLAEAHTYRVEGRAVRALELVENAVRLAPTDPGLHRQAAEMYEGMQRPQEALRELEAAVRVSEAPADAATLAWMARLRAASEAATFRALEDRDRGLWNALEPDDGGVSNRRAGRGR
jgi:tetratricopeptide (TPR) repeat protein